MHEAYVLGSSEKYGEFFQKSPYNNEGDVMVMGSRERAKRAVMTLPQAIYHAVHDMPGGVGAVAGAYKFNESTFNKKVNLNSQGHRLTADEFEAVLGFTRDPRLMDSLCDIFGDAAWIDLRGLGKLGDSALILQVGELAQRVGQMAKDIAEAAADGRIDIHELSVLRKDAAQLHQTVAGIIARAEAMAGGAACE